MYTFQIFPIFKLRPPKRKSQMTLIKAKCTFLPKLFNPVLFSRYYAQCFQHLCCYFIVVSLTSNVM